MITKKMMIYVALCCIACERPDLDLPPIVREGERVALGTDIDVEVCTGTLALLDAHVASVETKLNVRREGGKVHVYVFANKDDVFERCKSSGCFIPYERGGPAVLVNAEEYDKTVYHEIVHDILQHSGILPPDFLSEGIAYALGTETCSVSSEVGLNELLEMFNQKKMELDSSNGQQAGRFISYLLYAYGSQKLVAWAKNLHWKDGSVQIKRSFERVYGRSIDEEWAVQAVYSPPKISPDDELVPVLAWREGRVEHSFDMSCESLTLETLFSAPELRRNRAAIDLAEDEDYYFGLDGPVGQSIILSKIEGCGLLSGIDLEENDYRESGILPLFGDHGRFIVRRIAPIASNELLDFELGRWPPPPDCDAWEQDCPSGEKCQFFMRSRVTCEPLLKEPLKKGERCKNTEGLLFATRTPDPCDKGLECPDFVNHCAPLCIVPGDDSSCPIGEYCLNANKDFPGVCVQECDPFADNCPEGQLCTFHTERFLCSSFLDSTDGGTPQVGDDCLVVCGEGMHCAPEVAVPGCESMLGGCCTLYCDLTEENPTAHCPANLPYCMALDNVVGYCSSEPSD